VPLSSSHSLRTFQSCSLPFHNISSFSSTALLTTCHSHFWWDALSCRYDLHWTNGTFYFLVINLLEPMQKIHNFSSNGIKKFKNIYSRFLCCVCLIRRLTQVLFLMCIVNIVFFSSHFRVNILGLDLFSDAYFNRFTVCMVPSDKIAYCVS
jgi:hypothetical protein